MTNITPEQIETALLNATSTESVVGFVRVDNARSAIVALLAEHAKQTVPAPKPLNPEAVQRVLDYHGYKPAEPPHIEDLAPGMTFRTPGEVWTVHRDGIDSSLYAVSDSGRVWSLSDFDPSTIREVTPPKEQQ